MTTIGITHDRRDMVARPAERSASVSRILLLGGFLSSLLYVATDVFGGMLYRDYSFSSQAISELAAIGAPSKPFVDPLFMVYDFLAVAFGLGVLRVAGRNHALRLTALALVGLGVVGAAAGVGNSFFSMHQRGTAGSIASDSPHIALTAILVMLLLVAMVFGGGALGPRFRTYSLATIATVIVFGALTAQFAPRLALGKPTPGMGIVERIDVYSALLWIAVLAVALLRRPPTPNRGMLP